MVFYSNIILSNHLMLVKLPYPVDHNEPLYDTYMWSTVGVAAEVLTVFLQHSYTIGGFGCLVWLVFKFFV